MCHSPPHICNNALLCMWNPQIQFQFWPGAADRGWSGMVGPPLELGIYKVNSGISVCPAPFIVFGPPLDEIHSIGPVDIPYDPWSKKCFHPSGNPDDDHYWWLGDKTLWISAKNVPNFLYLLCIEYPNNIKFLLPSLFIKSNNLKKSD